MKKLVWRKWFSADWLSEAAVAKCSLGGRGLWAEVLNVMFSSNTHVIQGTAGELSIALRCSEADFCASFEPFRRSGLAVVTVEPSVTVTVGSNAIITIMSRRLENESKGREGNKLRQRKHRSNAVSHANVPLPLASSLCTGRGKGEGFSSPAVELPKSFPTCVEDAIDHGLSVGAPPDFVEATWNQAFGRGGSDARGQPIRSWAHHLAAQWKYDQNRRHEMAARGANGHHARPAFPETQLKAIQDLIEKHIANPAHSYDRKATDAECDHFKSLKRKLRELQQQIAGV